MLTFLAKRLLQLIPTLFFVSVLIFSLQQLLPGDPALIMAGEERDPEVIAQIRKQYRLDQPMPVQYVYWMKGVLTGDLGAVLFDEWKVAYLAGTTRPTSPARRRAAPWSAPVMYVATRTSPAGRPPALPDREGARRPLPGRRDLRGRLKRPATTATRPAPRPHQGRAGGPDELALRGRRRELHPAARGLEGVARDRRRPAPQDRRLRRLGDVRLHLGATRGSTTSPRSTSASGSSSSTTAPGAAGSREDATSPPSPSPTTPSISACRGSCREGEVDLVPQELERRYDVGWTSSGPSIRTTS